MTHRTLSPQEVSDLTNRSTSDHWSVQPDVRSNLYNAFKGGIHEVSIRGIKYAITYHDKGRAFVRNTEGFVPCGWFDTAALMRTYEQGA